MALEVYLIEGGVMREYTVDGRVIFRNGLHQKILLLMKN